MVNTLKNRKAEFSGTLETWLENLSRTGRGLKQTLSVLADFLLVVSCLWTAYSLRFGELFRDFASTWHLFALMPLATVLIFAGLGIYRWVVRSSNRRLFYQLGKACVLAALVLALITFLLPPDRGNPRSIFIIFGLLLMVGTFGIRFLWQGFFESGTRGEPIAIYGASPEAAQLVDALNRGADYRPVAIFDDNPALAGTMLGGVRVFKAEMELFDGLINKFDINRIVMASPKIAIMDYEAKVSSFRDLGIQVQTIPTYTELVSGEARVGQIRDLSVTDILGRSEVPPDLNLLSNCVAGKIVLVTGAGGSIGSELCRQIVAQRPDQLIGLDHSEENLYKLTEEMRAYSQREGICAEIFEPVLCSVNDFEAVDELICRHGIETVYHAAAYKHVPIIEEQPEQGVRVNVFGTLCVVDAAIANEVENFVLISTDKAVRPTNAMGATKRTAELVLQAKAKSQSTTRISMVRFGNVLGSSGSVVPKFKKQIELGGPITLTDPDITRFFMTIPEAAQLVLQASSIAKGGDVFVLDMGEPVRIEDLAVSMVRLMGKKLRRDTGSDKDIEIVNLGLRPGEKMYEELFITDSHTTTSVKRVFTANEAFLPWVDLERRLEYLSRLDSPADRPALRRELLDLAFFGQSTTAPVLDELPLFGETSGAKQQSTLEYATFKPKGVTGLKVS